MGDIWCRTCGEYMYESHKCPPTWLVWNPDDGDRPGDARRISAHTAERAAEEWAAQEDHTSAEYAIVGGSPARVCVRSTTGGRVQVFDVRGESVPQYTAEQVKLGKGVPGG